MKLQSYGRTKRYMDDIAGSFPHFLLYIFPYADYIADRSVLVLDSHIHDTAVIRDAVKFGMNLQPSLSKICPDVKWHPDKSAAFVFYRLNCGVKLVIFQPTSCTLE